MLSSALVVFLPFCLATKVVRTVVYAHIWLHGSFPSFPLRPSRFCLFVLQFYSFWFVAITIAISAYHYSYGLLIATYIQDALEFFLHFIDQVERMNSGKPDFDPSRSFKFGIEERLQCPSGKVAYNRRNDYILSLNIPLEKAINKSEFSVLFIALSSCSQFTFVCYEIPEELDIHYWLYSYISFGVKFQKSQQNSKI